MAIKRLITTFLLFSAVFFFYHSTASAYVLRGPHILSLMLERIGSPETLAVNQKLTLYPADVNNGEVRIKETLKYQFPEFFRSDTQNDQTTRIQVVSGGQSLTVINGKISSSSETGIDHYKDILFYRNRVLLENKLKMLDIDVSVSSLGRFNGRIVYIIGAKYPDSTKPQLWVGKESLQPIRLFIKNSADQKSFLEFRYIIWQKSGNVWYPMQTDIYREERLIRKIKVNRVDVNPHFAEDLFDIALLQSTYPEVAPVEDESQEPDELKDVQQSIEDLKKIFE